MMEEQTKQIKRLAGSKVTEIEDIGRGNRTEASFNNSTMESSQEQDSNPVVAAAQTMPPPFSTTHTGPPPPFSGASQQYQQNHYQQQDGNSFGSQEGRDRATGPKICRKLVKGT